MNCRIEEIRQVDMQGARAARDARAASEKT